MVTRISTSQDSILYHVQPGDSLNKIIKYYYGPLGLQQQKTIISQIQVDNPHIINPDFIYPGQALLIDIPQQYCPSSSVNQPTPIISADKEVLSPLLQQWQKATPQERNWLSAMTPVMLGTGAAGLTMINTTFKTNTPLLAEMAENYNDFKESKITKGQYDHRRGKLLYKLKIKLGPTQRILSGNKSANEVLRISRSKSTTPTTNISRQVNQMTRVSKYASRGGVVLSAAGLGVACYNIANTDNRQEKNEIFVESVGALGGGLLYGGIATLGVIVMATPIGWAGALFIGIGGALTGVGAGISTKYLYNTKYNHIDITKITKVDQLCR